MANTKGTSVINSPKGGGAQSGLGEKFSPDLFTGTGNFSVPIAVPPGRNGFQPELTLGYSSGNGNGIFGLGWALGIPGVTRKTSKGIPIYEDKSDIFILSGAEDLVPVAITQSVSGGIGWEQTTYRPRTEGLFARIIRHKKTNGEHYWEVRSKDGLVSYYGTPGATAGDNCVIANPELRDSIFAWHLYKTVDPFGNEIVYEYERDLKVDTSGKTNARSYDQLYISKIKYCQYETGTPLVKKYLCEVRFVYEERPDAFSAYKQGFETRTTKRCTKIETYTNAVSLIKTKTYHFNYKSKLPLNGASMLESVSVQGHNGTESEFMPPLEFSYSDYTPAKRDLKEIKGPIPIMSLAEPGFELVDLTGNGLPDLLQLNGTARYWTNKGNGEFSQPRALNIAPGVQLGMPGVQMIDANGDGRSDLMVNNGTSAGYFPGAFGTVWDANSFRPYKQIPSFSFADPEVHLIDLDGDGITDVLRNGKRFECFYNDPEKGFYKVRTADKKFTDFSFSDPRIRFADMTGDGLQDIVLISSGRVQYWPNLGYGRFGNKINMTNAPVFPEQYNPAQVLLGDLDGDGQADIAFVENNKVTLYINQSGNGFSAPVTIHNTPRVENPKALRLIDIMGTGQAGIVWSQLSGGTTFGRLFFLDFTHGNKPYVLEQMNNNMGSLTRVAYGSSVYHYLRDQKKPETRWKTDLPFPVQVVNKVEVHDVLSGGKLVTRYEYHNGYWDGVEREFRGFAHVDSYDTETFEKFNVQHASTPLSVTPWGDLSTAIGETFSPVISEHYSPPTLTKSWFYVGPVGDGFSRWKEPDFSNEYWSGDAQLLQRPADMVALLNALPRRARRDALRTLRGSLLRSELYALDNSTLKDRPYTVTESVMGLRKIFDPSQIPNPYWTEKNAYWSGGGYIFFPFNVAQRTTQYERGTEPMHSFSFTKEYDGYGQALGQLSVAVPRGCNPTAKGGSGNYLGTYSLSDYIYIDDTATSPQYMVNRVKRSRSFDATLSATGYNVFELRDAVFNNIVTLPVIGCTINYYDGPAFTGKPYGEMGHGSAPIVYYGAQVRSETQIIDTSIITAAYGTNTPECFKVTPDWNTNYPAAFAGQLQNGDNRLGYKAKSGTPYVDGWYAESARVKYDFQDSALNGTPYKQIGRVLQSRDVFDAWQEIEYDVYYTLPVKSTQHLSPFGGGGGGLETLATYDYRVMQPMEVKDPNENISVFDFSPLGLLRATALIGKGTEGDYKAATGTFYQKYEPSVKMEYDFFAFKNSGDPVWVKTISREKHYQQSAGSDTITKVEYSDGFGRLLQTRVQAEDVIFGPANASGYTLGDSGLPASQSAANAAAVGTQRGSGDLLNVVVSGWQLYNNKGKVVEQYEPFFDKGFDYVPADATGVKIKMFYDPLGRVVRTKNPDATEQWVIYGKPYTVAGVTLSGVEGGTAYAPSPWESYTYDANDLAPITHPGGSPVPGTHHYTPKSAEVDALGRTVKTTEHNAHYNGSTYENVVMQYQYDIRGNLMKVTDPLGRTVFTHVYDLRPVSPSDGGGKGEALPPLKTTHLDKGTSRVLFDATGKPIESTDAKGAHVLSGFDLLSRPQKVWAKDKSGENFTLRQYLVYGDDSVNGPGNPPGTNHAGQLYKHYDEAGLLEISNYDFKGNVLEKKRQVIKDDELKNVFNSGEPYVCYRVEWTGLPDIVSDKIYQTNLEYDALNRITRMQYPEDLDVERKELLPTYNRAGALEKVELQSGAGTSAYVEHIAYNAKGQRILAAYGNGIVTRYAYDPNTFRLLRQRSESYTSSGWTFTGAGNVKQDTAYDYDFAGNILHTHDKTTNCGVGGVNGATPNSLTRDFTYDPLYRVLTANGRENSPTLTPEWNDTYRSDDNDTTTYYKQDYMYDKLGNIQILQHTGNNNFTRTFNYTPNSTGNLLNSVTVGSSTYNFTYDANGNQLTETSSRKWEWDYGDKARCFYVEAGGNVTQYTQYLYDAGGQRVKKYTWKLSGDSDSNVYIDGTFEHRVKGPDEQNTLHIMDNQSRIATRRIGNALGDTTPDVKYNLEDFLGSSTVQLSPNGADVSHEEYYPFGETSFGCYALKKYRYVGKERDFESGLYYYGARYYNAWTCKFISVDPLAADYPFYTPYNYAGNKPIHRVDIDGLEPAKPGSGAGPFKLGTPQKPIFTYDNGFLGPVPEIGYTPNPRKPDFSDYSSYTWWGVKLLGSYIIRWDLGNANKAYYHFRNGGGKDFNFDLADYFDDDDSGKMLLNNAKNIAKESAMKLLDKSGTIKMTSEGFQVSYGGDARFPYPATEDWQKAIGAFNFWMGADVTAVDKDGVITYTMTLTINAEDKYNFNPGQEDIATGTPDSANGIFELTGLGHQFMQYGTYTEVIIWSEKSKNTTAPTPQKKLDSAPTSNTGGSGL